jgi:amino acid adenylation domain-containing protein
MSNLLERLGKLTQKQLMLLAFDQQRQLEAASQRRPDAIGVIGIGCRFPGGGDGPQAFWELLHEGRDAIREIPGDRWDIDSVFDPDPDAPARMSVRRGGFLDDVGGFDAAFFGISPREALTMDPQQRLLLEVTWEALEHANVAADRLMGSATGVFVGLCNSDHFQRMLRRGNEAIDAYLASGNAPSVAAGRIAYSLGLRGPALTVDTSCSASLVAIHLACQSLRSGESRMALVGGANVICSPETMIALSKAHMLAPDGRCKTFDAAADGFARGEGCGVLVLKRLRDAVSDGDTVHAVIRGTAVNQDGRSSGLTVPNGPAQESVIRAALDAAGAGPDEIDYVEAHGTGTSLGDPIEIRALSAALGAHRPHGAPLLVGSVKTNLGHLEAAAGVAGVIKVVLALENGSIPPHLHFRHPSPHIPWADYQVAVASTAHPWPPRARPRMAGVSSFGFSGTNAHVVIQEAPREDHHIAGAEPRSLHCLPLSARSATALAKLAASYAQTMADRPDLALGDVAHTAGVGRSHFPQRLAVVADTAEAAVDALRAFASGGSHPALHNGTAAPGQPAEVVFRFAGPDQAYPGMGRQLYDTSGVYRDAVDRCDRLIGPDASGRTLTSMLWPSRNDETAGCDPFWAPLMLFATQYAAAQLWKSFGVEPVAVIGDGDGEYTAACVAAVFSLEDGLRIIGERARLLQAAHPSQDALDAWAGSVPGQAPHIPVAWTGGGPGGPAMDAAPDARYWACGRPAPGAFAAAITRLHEAGYRSFLDVSTTPALSGRESLGVPEAATPQLAPPVPGQDDWSRIACTLAELYVQGGPVNWGEVTKGARKHSLPTYPFERRSYWYSPAQLDDLSGSAATRGFGQQTVPTALPSSPPGAWAGAGGVTPSPSEPPAEDLFYQVLWQQAPLPVLAAASLTAPDRFAPAVRERFAMLAGQHGLSVYDRLLPELDRLSAAYVANALRQLGFDATVGRVFAAGQEAARLGIAPRHARLFTRLLASLAADGVVRRAAGALEIIGPLPAADPEQSMRAAIDAFGEVDGELGILQRCGSELARVLTGEQDALELLFPGGSFSEARKLYIESPAARTYNSALAEALGAAIERVPPDAMLRVLEIGAGTGGTTSYVLPLLPSGRVEYVFTDVSQLFLERAAAQFGRYDFLRTSLLDIERNPFDQGFQPGQFDVVIAANALHATQDLAQTVGHVRSLLAPGGLLFLLEGIRPQRWTNVTFGIIEGWWRFTDVALRPDHPLIDTDTWRGLLEGLGFDCVRAIPENRSRPLSERQQAIIIARAPEAMQRWTLVGDRDGVAAVLAARLRERGDAVTVLSAETADASVPDGDNLVYLGALELAVRQDTDLHAAQRCMSLACEIPIRWLAAFGGGARSGRAWLVTQGAQAVQGQAALGQALPEARWQVPLWGIGRAFSLERPDRWGGLVDLPPEDGADTVADTLLAAFAAGDGEDQTGYRNGMRYAARLAPAAAPEPHTTQFVSDATYLITGGFGGLGLQIARWMAGHGARHIALLGRHPDKTSEAVREIESLGTRIIPLAGDIADETGMRGLLAQLAMQAPPLRGIVHAAADVSAARIHQLTTAQIRAMLRPKIEGTVVLERVTRDAQLDFLVLFSSTAALLGYAELAHYAAANLFLDATAAASDRPGRRVIAINWGAWAGIRMASAETRRSFQEAGLLSMSADAALDALGRLLAGPAAQGIVARIDWTLYKPLLELRRSRPFLSLVGAPARPVGVGKALAAPPAAARGLAEDFAERPAAERQKLLLAFVEGAVAAVLGAEDGTIPADLDLLELGMDSLMAVELRRRIEAGVGKPLPSNLLFNHPRVSALATFLSFLLEIPAPGGIETPGGIQMRQLQPQAPQREPSPPLPADPQSATIGPDRAHRLSYSQKALWFLHQQAPHSTAYNISLPVRVLSALDTAALRRALQRVIDRHAILRTTYDVVDGEPGQQVAGRADVAFDVHAVPGLCDADLQRVLEADAGLSFDLKRGPIIRAGVYTRGPRDHALLVSMHHIAVDGWSIMMLIEEILKFYAEETRGAAAYLALPGLTYDEYTQWQQDMLAGAEGERLWSYWRDKLAPSLERLVLPTDHPRPVIQTFKGASLRFRLGSDNVKAIMALARQARTTPFVVMLAAFQLLLSRLGATEDVIVGTSTFARSKPEFMPIVGDFVNSVPIRGRLAANLSFRDFIGQLATTVLEAIEAQEFPLPLLIQRLRPERSADGSPLFNTFFSLLRFQQFKGFALLYGDESDDAMEIGGLRLAAFPIEQGSGQFDLSLQMVEIGDSIRGALQYNTDLFDETTIRGFMRDFHAVIHTVLGDPDVTLAEVRKVGAVASPHDDIGQLLDQLAQRDIRLSLDGDRLRINAPRGALDDELKARIAERRDDILARLRMGEPPAQNADADAIHRIVRTGPLPVSAAQQRLWFLNQMHPGNAHYAIGGGLRLRGMLDIGVMQQAIHDLTVRHEAFRTTIGERDGRPWLTISETSTVPVDVLDFSLQPSAERLAAARRAGEALLRRPFDLASGPLAAFLILRLGDDDHMLFLTMHHIVSDGWSLAIACHELCALYEAGLVGRPANLAALAVDSVDHAAWEAEQLRSGRLDEHLAYWKRQLHGAPAALALPTDRKRPPVPSHRGGRLRCYLDGGLIASLEQCSREHGTTLFMTLLAAWQVLIYRHSGQEDVVIGTPMANRDIPALEGVIGCLVNNVVMRGRLGGNPGFNEFLEQVKQTTLAAFDHRVLPFDRLVQGLNPERSAGHAPIFQVLFTLMSFPTRSLAPAGLSAEFVDLDSGVSRFDLTIELSPVTTGSHNGEFAVLYDYNSDLFDPPTISRMHQHFDHLLRAIAADPACPVDDLPLLGRTDEHRLLEEWNATSVPHDRTRCVHQLLEASAHATPDAIAVIAGSVAVNYRTLEANANRLAHLLGRQGVGRGAMVAVCLERTADIPMAMAAVLKAGAAYVPLDPTHPEERLQYILQDAEISWVITTSSLLPIFDGVSVTTVLLDEAQALLEQQPATAPTVAVQPDDLAYVIYTSGSTGRPKGVEIEHRNVVSFLQAMRRRPGLRSSDRLLAVTTLAFDIAGLEIWLPLSVGATIVIASRTDVLDGVRLAGLIDTHDITVLQATPASWRLLIAAGWTGKGDLQALCGGEALPTDLAAALVDCTGELWNMYGPTETTIWSTVGRVSDATETITIGRPIANTQTFILETSGQLAPVGVVGELCIGGEGVARGYRKRPDLTAEKFVPVKLPDGRTVRVYRTGDLARFRGDGELELLGRRDHQVKIRGYRVEPGEIEAVLASCPGVKACVVVPRAFSAGDERLVGYVTVQDGIGFDADIARAALRRQLPEYMIPALFVVLPALPLTPNNKIDRTALPPPAAPEGHAAKPANVLMTSEQRRVAGLWREILQVDHVGLNENFFDAGGHSLLLVKLHAGLRHEFAADFPLIELFQQTTVASQAERLSSISRSDAALVRTRIQAERQFHG